MTTNEIFEKVRAIIADQLDIDEDLIELDTNVQKDLDADSLDAVEIIMGIEDEFGIETPDDDMAKFYVVENIVSFIEDHI